MKSKKKHILCSRKRKTSENDSSNIPDRNVSTIHTITSFPMHPDASPCSWKIGARANLGRLSLIAEVIGTTWPGRIDPNCFCLKPVHQSSMRQINYQKKPT